MSLKREKIIIVTGLSGSGKSTAIKALEDAGFFCVDNLPVVLLPSFLEVRGQRSTDSAKLALVMDIREKDFVSSFSVIRDELMEAGYSFKIIFLEAAEQELIRRYSQTRRHHPLDGGEGLLAGIRAERVQLEALRRISDRVIDTTRYNVHDLKAMVSEYALKETHGSGFETNIVSFGFKYGIPLEADLVVDVRFLPNPHFVPELRDLDGTSSPVQEFVKKWDQTRDFLERFLGLVDFLVPLYQKEGKSYLTVAIGCTGGRHRSVTIAREVFHYLREKLSNIHLTHRDIALG